MRRSIVVADSFYRDPFAVRAYALDQRWYRPYQSDADVEAGRSRATWMTTWRRSAARCPFKSSTQLLERLEQLTASSIDRQHWNIDFPITDEGKAALEDASGAHGSLWNCCFHFKPRNAQALGEGVHNHVTDGWNGVGHDGWTGLIYLTPLAPVDGGVRLWRNRTPERQFVWMPPAEEWEQIDALGNVFNRLVLVRGNVPHSGHAGWGATPADGRLFQTFFFRVCELSEPSPVDVTV
jgi:hypothetical protein